MGISCCDRAILGHKAPAPVPDFAFALGRDVSLLTANGGSGKRRGWLGGEIPLSSLLASLNTPS